MLLLRQPGLLHSKNDFFAHTGSLGRFARALVGNRNGYS